MSLLAVACFAIIVGGVMENKRKIIDVHTHIFPDKIAMRAVSNVGNYYGINMGENGTALGLFESARDLEARFVVSSAALKVENVRHGNDFLLTCAAANKDKMVALGSVHQDMGFKSMISELEYLKENGARGLKLHPDFQNFKIEDPKMFPIYEAAQSLKLPILFHVGDENTVNSTPKALRFVADKFPDLDIIAAHMGGYMAWDEADEYLIGSRVYMDTSDALLVLSKERVTEQINRHGADRIMFGSDFPLKGTYNAFVEFDSLAITEEQKEQIYHKTAEKLFNM